MHRMDRIGFINLDASPPSTIRYIEIPVSIGGILFILFIDVCSLSRYADAIQPYGCSPDDP